MNERGLSTITLHARLGRPLADAAIREMVIANAYAIAERQGVDVTHIETEPDRITVTLDAGRIEALGFAAELRRLTERWYGRKYDGAMLWGSPAN